MGKVYLDDCECGRKKDVRSKKCRFCVGTSFWSNEEIDFLKKNYPILSSKEIAKKLNKGASAVRMKVINLGILNSHKEKSNKSKKYSGVIGLKTNWKGGRIITTEGYIRVYSPEHPFKDNSGYVLEHRLIVEKFIGRYLTKEEVIHHLNEDKQDNRIENLMIFPNGKEHIKFHIKIAKYGLTYSIRRQITFRWKDYKIN
jgi:uncharacterized protein (DUF1330 family)